MKRPRGRPPKKRLTANSRAVQPKPPAASVQDAKEDEVFPACSYDPDEASADVLSLLPPLGPEESAEQSSEALSGTEAEGCDSRSSSVSVSSKRRRKNNEQQRFKKTSLKAGLFADGYKREEEVSAQPDGRKAHQAYYNPEEHPYGLLPAPSYCGKALRAKREDFQLPFDLWWLHSHRQLPGRDVAATWNYKRIKSNVGEKLVANFEVQACHCTLVEGDQAPGCGEECINRQVI